MVSQSKDDVVINVRVNFEQAKKDLADAKKNLRNLGVNDKSVQGLVERTRAFAKAQQQLSTVTEGVGDAAKRVSKGLQASFANIGQSVLQNQKSQQTYWNQYFKNVKGARQITRKELSGVKKGFDSASLGILFFGLAIKRVFDLISKSGIATFREVVSSTEGAVSEFDRLEGSLKFLQFTIGQALEPFVALIIPIVDAVGEWVSQNQKLAAGLLITIGVLGNLLFLAATLKLGLGALLPALKSLGVVAAKAGSALVSALGAPVIAAIVLAIAALIVAFKTNLGNIQELFSKVGKRIKDVFSAVIELVVGLFKGLVLIIQGIFEGDFTKVFQGIITIVASVIKAVIKLFFALGDIIVNIFLGTVNIVNDLFFNLIKLIVGGIKKIIELANLVPGVNIGTSGFDKVLNTLEEAKKANRFDFVDSSALEQKAIGAIDKVVDVVVNVEANVELDGDQIAQNTSNRIVDQVQRQGA